MIQKSNLKQIKSQELQMILGGTTCPGMGDYYAAGFSGAYVRSFLKGVIKGIVSYF